MNWFKLNRLLLLLLPRPSRSCPLPPARSLPDMTFAHERTQSFRYRNAAQCRDPQGPPNHRQKRHIRDHAQKRDSTLSPQDSALPGHGQSDRKDSNCGSTASVEHDHIWMVRRSFRCRICYPCNDGESAASRAAGHWSNSRRCANPVEQDSDSVREAREKLKTAAGTFIVLARILMVSMSPTKRTSSLSRASAIPKQHANNIDTTIPSCSAPTTSRRGAATNYAVMDAISYGK
ncbi:uncharacterized protein SCHCODRAFT_02674411 [Schizophyllum commune H4-8]|uniref:Uncharacterized protein n=1 Tax=Schizophyllum commune (strain H4-8 / FGSC 9210) TaxID=578458 RepID=D8PSN1_SCHCM|nr:uncharacterized protein SCHCODRAFT_02674411 [Schizophyllum commune H4-8]KAI5899624.1 hypothetical protein SCHCODRAFT_02674411 [Schizophyllum commune H4-8]